MTREKLKNWAKTALNRSYWKAVLVGFILSFTAGTASSSGGGSSSGDFSDLNFENMSEEEIMIILGIVLVVLCVGFAIWIVGILLKAFLLNPLHVGCQAFFCDGLESEDPDLYLLGRGFKGNYKNVAKTMFFRDMYLSLWSMLSWIPTLLFIGICVFAIMMEDSGLAGIILIIGFLIFFAGLIAAMIPFIMKTYEYWLIPYILADNPDMECKEVFALTKKMMTGHKWEAFVLILSFIGWELLSVCTCGILSIFYVEPYKAYTLAGFYKVRVQQNNYLNGYNSGYDNSYNGGYNSGYNA